MKGVMTMVDVVSRLSELFQKEMGVPLPLRLPGDCEPVPGAPGLVGVLRGESPVLDMSDLGRIRSLPAGFFQAGFWGHGVNSYAFYWCEVTDRVRVFLRLPYGGAYMNPEKERANVLRALFAVREFLHSDAAQEAELLLVASWMGSGGVVATYPGSVVVAVPNGTMGLPGALRRLALARRNGPDAGRTLAGEEEALRETFGLAPAANEMNWSALEGPRAGTHGAERFWRAYHTLRAVLEAVEQERGVGANEARARALAVLRGAADPEATVDGLDEIRTALATCQESLAIAGSPAFPGALRDAETDRRELDDFVASWIKRLEQ
jgi:hypothetical protein